MVTKSYNEVLMCAHRRLISPVGLLSPQKKKNFRIKQNKKGTAFSSESKVNLILPQHSFCFPRKIRQNCPGSNVFGNCSLISTNRDGVVVYLKAGVIWLSVWMRVVTATL